MPKLILVDAHGYIHRAYHALPPLRTSRGEPAGAVYGFARMLFKILWEQKPEYLVVCFDSSGPTFRHKIYPDYKATRKEIDEDLRFQFPLSRELVQAMGLASLEKKGFEADDLIATMAKKAEKENMEVVIVSTDKDLLQLVDDHIKVLNEMKQVFYGPPEVREKWGVPPERILDFLILTGDSSDNIPGVPGIGEKTAVKLLGEFGSLQQLLENGEKLGEKIKEKLLGQKGNLSRNRELLALDDHVPVDLTWEQCKVKKQDKDLLIPFLTKMEFHRLISDLYAKGIFSGAMMPPHPGPLPQNGGEGSKSPITHNLQEMTEYETVLTKDQLESLVKKLGSSNIIALDTETTGLNVRKSELVGISFSWKKGHAAYIPLLHRTLGAPQQLPLETVLSALKGVLEDEKIKKAGHNIKFDLSMLEKAGVHVRNIYFDTMVASYCLDPSRTSYGLKQLSLEFLGVNMTRIEEFFSPSQLRSRGKELAMDQLEIDKVSPYACADADCTLQLYEKFTSLLKERECESLFYDIEMPLVEILEDMELAGIGVDPVELNRLNEEFSREIRKLENESHKLAGQEFNLNSSKQLAHILFEKLKLPAAKKTKTGFSTDEDVLTMLSSAHELPRILLRHRELSKLKSTYIEGLLSEVDQKTRRIHTHFNQTGTATGRLSSSDPNLQNIPIRTEQGRMIRRAFVAGKGRLFLSLDYSQIDLRSLAHLSGDPSLIKAFCEGADIHRATAAEVFHLAPKDVTEQQRSRAKAINFGIVYGQQSYGLSQSLGITASEAQDMIENYFKRYPLIREWMEETKKSAKTMGYVKTLFGRRRSLPQIASKNGSIRSFAERMAINTPVQGTSADIIKIAMIRIVMALKRAERKLNADLLLQVHDDLLFEVPEQELEETAKIVKKEMENAVKLSVPLFADAKKGGNWADMAPFNVRI